MQRRNNVIEVKDSPTQEYESSSSSVSDYKLSKVSNIHHELKNQENTFDEKTKRLYKGVCSRVSLEPPPKNFEPVKGQTLALND